MLVLQHEALQVEIRALKDSHHNLEDKITDVAVPAGADATPELTHHRRTLVCNERPKALTGGMVASA
jgi:hypothetical protein